MKKLLKTGLIFALLTAFAGIASAQSQYDWSEGVAKQYTGPSGAIGSVYPVDGGLPTPGNAWVYLGNTSPIEKGDIFSDNHIEQGFGIFRHGQKFLIEGYGAFDINADTQGQIWANNYIGQFGVKANYALKHGVITIGVARAYEDEWNVRGQKAQQNEGYLNTWFGWQAYAEHKYPGNTWTTLGDISPVEKGNMIMMTYVEQGYVVHRFSSHTALVPVLEETFGADMQRYDWNNFTRTGGGVSLKLPRSVEIDGVYNYEVRPISGQSAGGFMFTFKTWSGWNLASVLKGFKL